MPELPIRAISGTPLNIPRVQTMGQSQGYVFNGGAWIPTENVAAMPCPNVPLRPDQSKPGDPMQVNHGGRSISVHPHYAYGAPRQMNPASPHRYVMMPQGSGPRLSPRSASPNVSPRHRTSSSPRRTIVMLGAKETMQAASTHCTLSEEVTNFLNDLGFSYYAEAFRMNGFEDMDTVLAMSQEDMRGIGVLPGHVLKLDLKLDQICEQRGLPRRGKQRFQFPAVQGQPWMPMAGRPMGNSPTGALSPATTWAGMMPRTQQSLPGPAASSTQPSSAPMLEGVFRKQLALSPVADRTPSPVDKDIHEISAGWTDGREWAVPTVDEESEHDSPTSATHPDAGSGIQEQEGSSSEPPATSASPSTSTTCTFTPHPARANLSFNSGMSSGMFAFAPRRDQFGSGCTNFSVQTAPPGSATPASVRFGAGQRKLKRQEMDEIVARNKAQRKVFTWLQQNRFSNVNAERWFLGRAYFPLHAAVRENNTEMVKLLLELKADPMKKNSGGLTPLDYAQSKQRSSVICDMLQDFELTRQGQP
eukprot:symbB.v1.2.010428.t1/scaffold655.1/size176010/15